MLSHPARGTISSQLSSSFLDHGARTDVGRPLTSSAHEASAGAAMRRAALSRELGEFLIEFSIGVHRFSMYPPNHPSLGPVVESMVVHLAGLFRDRETLNLGVANRQLIIEGVATDKKHPVLSDLARRLHDQQLGAISFKFGVRAQDIDGLLRTLAESADDDELPLGMLGEALPTWPHITLHPLGYEGLKLRESKETAGVGEVGQLWLGLAQAALSGRGAGRPALKVDWPTPRPTTRDGSGPRLDPEIRTPPTTR